MFAPIIVTAALAAQGFLTVEVHSMGTITSIPRGAQRVPVLTLQFVASCASDVTMQSITLHREGLGSKDDILRVYALRRGVRISGAPAPVNEEGEVQLIVRNFTIAACGREKVIIHADFSGDAALAGEHRFTLREPSAVDAMGTSVSLVQLGERGRTRVTPKELGTITVESRRLVRPPHYGTSQIVGRVLLKADSRDNHLIHVITFTNKGRARGADLENLVLETSRRERLSNILRYLDEDKARFELTPPLFLGKNETRILQIRANIRASRKRTFEFVIEEPSDVEATPAPASFDSVR